MLGIVVERIKKDIVIKYQLAELRIPISDIIKVTLDDTNGGIDTRAIRIGNPSGTTDRVVIKTKSNSYILFTTNYTSIMNRLKSAIATSELFLLH
jgi:hypothetical protein